MLVSEVPKLILRRDARHSSTNDVYPTIRMAKYVRVPAIDNVLEAGDAAYLSGRYGEAFELYRRALLRSTSMNARDSSDVGAHDRALQSRLQVKLRLAAIGAISIGDLEVSDATAIREDTAE